MMYTAGSNIIYNFLFYHFIRDNTWNIYLAASREYFLLRKVEEEEGVEKDQRILQDVDRRWIPSVRRDRETFYESFYERLYEPWTELGPRVRFCYTRAVTATRPPETPRGPILILHLSLSFPLRAASQRVFSIDPRKCLVFHHHHIRRRYLVFRSIASFSLSSPFPFFPHNLVLLGYISWLVFFSAKILFATSKDKS